MCDSTARSGDFRRIPRPRWGRLWTLVVLVLTALAAIQIVVAPGRVGTTLQCGLALGGFGAMAWWTRRNRVALDALSWCECAGATVAIRVIPSRRPTPVGIADEPGLGDEKLEEVAR